MPRIQLPLVLGALVGALVLPAPASAAFFPGLTVDGPSADIVRLGGVDVARDGSGVAVYVKRVAGIDHVFAVRLVGGQFQPPERLDGGLVLASSAPVAGVANGGKTIVAFVNNGQLYTVLRRAGATTWPAPVAVPGAASAATPSIDLSVNGVGYVVWSSAGDVRAATLARTGAAFAPLDAPLDITPAADAGSGLGRPQVATSADGTALVAWGEGGHVYARRLFHLRQSTIPSDLTMSSLAGHAGGVADTPEVDISDDSSFAWVAFRQAFDNGTKTRVLARQLIGSAFDPPYDVGPGGFAGENAGSPALDVSGGNDAILAAEGASTHALEGDLYFQDRLLAPFALAGPGSVPAQPAVAEGETGHATAAWFAAAGTVHARGFEDGKAADPEAPVTDPALGPVDGTAGLFAGSDRFANTVIGFVQGTGAGRRLALAVWDRAPTSVLQTTSVNWRRAKPLNWGAVEEHWGDITYAVFIDGRPVGTTTLPTMPIAGHVTDGLHTWRVTATDQHGQSVSSIRRSLRIDTTGPNVSVSITGKRTAGTSLKITVHARDAHAGLQVVKVDFGEGGAPAFGRVVRHTYGAGSHTVTVKAVDRAGNATVVVRPVTVRR